MIAVVISYLTARQAIAGWRALAFLATAPVAVPGIVLGVGLFLSYTRPPFVLYGTLWILLIAFVTIALPAAYQQLQSAFRAVNPDLEEASRILGATRLQALGHITAPLLRTSVIATWCFIFVGVIRELSAAIILFTSETKVISVLIFDLNESRRPRRHRGARHHHAGHHLRGGDRDQPHPGLRRRAAAQRMSALPEIAVAEHLAERIAALDGARRGAREMHRPCGRRDRPVRHGAQRGLRPGDACGLRRRRPVHGDRPCAHPERRGRRAGQRHGGAWRGFRRHLRGRPGACRRGRGAGGARRLRAAQSGRRARRCAASRSASRCCAA